MFGPGIQQRARRIAESIVRPLAALGLTPNMATLIGFVLNALTAWVIATGNLRLGGAMLLFAGVFDMFDGALARVRNQKTVFGAFFDSTIDRFSEGVVLLGIIVYALTQPIGANRIWIVCLAYAAGLGSLMVSYARARAEGLGLEAKTGLMARPERVVLLSAGLLLGGFVQPSGTGILWTLAVLAITSVFTSVQRIVTVYRMLARRERAARAGERKSQDLHAQELKANTMRGPANRAFSASRPNGRSDRTGDSSSTSLFGKRRSTTRGEFPSERASRR